jgi:hypothetical protein
MHAENGKASMLRCDSLFAIRGLAVLHGFLVLIRVLVHSGFDGWLLFGRQMCVNQGPHLYHL